MISYQKISDLLLLFKPSFAIEQPIFKTHLLSLVFLESNTHFQKEKMGEKLAAGLKQFLTGKDGFIPIKNSSERRSLLELGFSVGWGGVVYVQMTIGYESRSKLIEKVLQFAEKNSFDINPQNGILYINF